MHSQDTGRLDNAESRSNSYLWIIVVGVSLLLMGLSSLRHALFYSSALDLGYHDQILYLLSVNEKPIVSFWGSHFLGGHAEWLYYPLSLLYKLAPNVHWLFAIQAFSLAVAIVPLWHLGFYFKLTHQQLQIVVLSYLLYPLVFNINFFDFHPEVMAVPLLFLALLFAYRKQTWLFCLAITLVLGCRASLSLLAISLGLWLIFFVKRKVCGIYSTSLGIIWFLVFTQILVPHFKPDGYHAVSRYSELGDSIGEIAINVFLRPDLLATKVFTFDNAFYLILLIVPVLWGFSVRHLSPLLAALPILGMNLISDTLSQKDLVHQYSVPILPFLLLIIILNLAHNSSLLKKSKSILIWCFLCFLILAKYTSFAKYFDILGEWDATRQAVAQIETKGCVLTTSEIAPHLTHRQGLYLLSHDVPSLETLEQYQYVLLSLRHPGYGSSLDIAQQTLERIETMPDFSLQFEQDEVYLFLQNSWSESRCTP
ncbi:MAG: DUF2079 domain-containing protein [Jaaginema sp. PMC 1079.18]|nr:DUF2079 domain-containing protein [Jaaginema sp. PMC 1080.18]MEC4849409.1 DUF2079 domain-containing protein [Jaaginema sp. PMC 1079.18]MEC4864959.1 DUF2079 domain-containing protein [Jaaginema sp. PMC 1078.18]